MPWFCVWLDEEGKEVEQGQGTPDFRVTATGAINRAINRRLCWICGEPLGSYKAFIVGPMCVVNRVTSEAPTHLSCAEFAVEACPFLARPQARRREAQMPHNEGAAGIAILRNPGVAVIWVTKSFRPRNAPPPMQGVLIDMGEPISVNWYREGRPASREEVDKAMEEGLPNLKGIAEAQGGAAVRALEAGVEKAKGLLPA